MLSSPRNQITLTTSLCLLFITMFVFPSANHMLVSAMTPRIAPRLTNAGRQSLRTRGDLSMMKTSSRKYIRVVTDIDDTVKSSGGVKLFGVPLGGIDKQYSRGEFYPGAFQFFFELSKFNQKSSKNPIPRVAVLTARARELLFVLALKPTDKLCSTFSRIGKENGVDDWGVAQEHVYYGSVVEWVLSERKGLRKFMNFDLMISSEENKSGDKPNYIFIGDTGERDEDAGERIIRKHGKSTIKAVFLHAVTDKKDRSKLRVPEDRVYRGVPIYYFRTYVGAAGKACKQGLINQSGLLRVVDAAREDVEIKEKAKLKPTALLKGGYPFDKDIKASRRSELESDIAMALKLNGKTKAKDTPIGVPAFMNFRI